jgi:hypothetical protein
MTRAAVAVIGVLLLAVLGLAAFWLLGQLIVGVGAFMVGMAGVLAGLLKFLLLSGVLCGLVYFVTSSWRRPS